MSTAPPLRTKCLFPLPQCSRNQEPDRHPADGKAAPQTGAPETNPPLKKTSQNTPGIGVPAPTLTAPGSHALAVQERKHQLLCSAIHHTHPITMFTVRAHL